MEALILGAITGIILGSIVGIIQAFKLKVILTVFFVLVLLFLLFF